MVGSPPSSSSWKNPSAEAAAKYNLVELPESFKPTPQEEDLLKMYEKRSAYEKEAKRIREEQARTKLAAADLKYKQSMETTTATEGVAETKKKKPRKKKAKQQQDGMMEAHEKEEYSSEEEEQEPSLNERRAQKLEELREAVKPKESEEEAMRAQLLNEEADVTDTGPSLKRKRTEVTATKSSLLDNLTNQATPPHEFSKKLELKTWQGKILFPTSANETSWSPPPSASQPNEGALELELPDFDISQAQHGQGNNTIAIKFTSPTGAKRFSLNIAGPDHADFYTVLFHFNPRALERGGQLVINDKKEGMWGQGVNVPLSQLPLIFGQEACTLVIQINGDGFDVFLGGKHCARLEHRQRLPSGRCSLFLQFPSTDDYGSPELWTVYRVWWGNKESMAKSDLSDVAGVNVYDALHPRKLFISGLQKITTQQEVDYRRAELERAFRKYGGDHGIIATVPMNTTFAFVELESKGQAELALREMHATYRLNPARRSRYDALQEERAEAEAANTEGTTKSTSDWD